MAWIEVHDNLREHRKVYALSDELRVNKATVIGILTCFWSWCIVYAQEGDLTGIPAKAIASACEWDKKPEHLVAALIKCGWLDANNDGTLTVHDWFDYAGRLVEKRAKNAERMRDARAHNVQRTCDARAGATVPNLTVPNVTTIIKPARACDLDDAGFAAVADTFRENIHDPTPAEREILVDIYDLVDPDVTVAVIKAAVAAGNGKGNAKYIEVTVRNLAEQGITSINAYHEHTRQWADKKARMKPQARAPDAATSRAYSPLDMTFARRPKDEQIRDPDTGPYQDTDRAAAQL